MVAECLRVGAVVSHPHRTPGDRRFLTRQAGPIGIRPLDLILPFSPWELSFNSQLLST